MSRFTGKSDFCDTCTMHYEPKEIVERANIFMGNAKVHIQQERDLIPYYTNLISMMYSTKTDNGLEMSISLSEDSFIDSEERSRLSWRVANIISIARKCKRNKVPFTFEQVQNLLGIGLVTPFAVLCGMGPRCYHISHFCLLVAGCSCVAHKSFSIPVKGAVYLLLALTAAGLFQTYTAIGACTALREELHREARNTGADMLVLPYMDERYIYSWGYNPQNDIRAAHYREYYHLPEDITLILLPCGSVDLWPDIPQQMYDEAVIYP